LPRHQTLAAAIDWSYELLPDNERAVLRRLSVFVGAFVLESAIAVVSDDNGSKTNIAADIGNLVAKSLVSVETCGHSLQYRLLDSMRAYARHKLERSGEVPALLRRQSYSRMRLRMGAPARASFHPRRCIDRRARCYLGIDVSG
jgi:predicted ATPase